MSHENVEVVKLAYESFALGGLDRYMDHFTDDVDYRAVEGGPDDTGPIHGKDALRAWLQDWIDTFDEFWFEPVELIDAGADTVVAVERFGGRAKLSGVDTDQTEAVVFSIRDGKVARCREYATRSEALEAIGSQRPRGASLAAMDRTALIVVDVQRGFDDAGFWGPRNNTACEENVRSLIAAWRGNNQPIVFVRHHWDEDGSPLRSDEAGSEFKDVVEGRPDLLVTKTVHSAFHGTPDLHDWLGKDEIDKLMICGIQTNMCCETTARVGSDLGYEVGFAIDATHTFDQDDHDGGTVTADELARVTASNLDPEFGRVLSTDAAIAELNPPGSTP